METLMRDWVALPLEFDARLMRDIGAEDRGRWVKIERRHWADGLVGRILAALLPQPVATVIRLTVLITD